MTHEVKRPQEFWGEIQNYNTKAAVAMKDYIRILEQQGLLSLEQAVWLAKELGL